MSLITEDMVVAVRHSLEPLMAAYPNLKIAVVLLIEPDVSILRCRLTEEETHHLLEWITEAEPVRTVDFPEVQ